MNFEERDSRGFAWPLLGDWLERPEWMGVGSMYIRCRRKDCAVHSMEEESRTSKEREAHKRRKKKACTHCMVDLGKR